MIKPIRFTTDGLDKRGPAVALAYDGMPTPEGHTRTDARTGAHGTARRIREMLPDAFAPFTEAVQEYRDAQEEVKRLQAIIADARTPTELHIAEREGKIESAKAKIAELTETKEQLSEAEADVHMALSFFHHLCQHDHEAMKALNATVAAAHAERYAAAHAKAEKIRSMASELVERLGELPDQTAEADLLTPQPGGSSNYTNRPATELRQHLSSLDNLCKHYAVKEAVTA